jgi:hypothetical protein
MRQRREKCILRVCRKRKGKKPLGRPRRTRKDNVEMDFKEIKWVGGGLY